MSNTKRDEWKKVVNGEHMRSQSDVALSIAKRLLQDNGKDSNIVFSPLSIQFLLSLICAGCNGPILDQLLSFLKANSIDQLNHFGSFITSNLLADASSTGGPKLSFANGLWLNQSHSLKHPFKHIVETYYKATLRQADFYTKGDEVILEVNSWVKDKTKGLITDILLPGSVDGLTQLILVNALYFKGDWKNEFDDSETKEGDFYLVDGSSIKTPFMRSGKDQYIAAYDGFKVLTMPYRQGQDDKDRRFSMCIFLPDAKDGLASLIEKVDSESGFMDRHIPHKKVEVGDFQIPKFKVSYECEVSDVLKKLGLVLPFEERSLLEMVETETGEVSFVSSIFHKSIIEANEKGTEAASIHFGSAVSSSWRFVNTTDFVADHPFLFAIREDVTRTLVFVGQVLDPTLGLKH
ncbi:serpin-ZX-like [Cucumis melo var. makuwa]|uniref:Serpin-ZX-like n=1 Tax=Cucumis melo var. makuwa TaxID=1194695 RepID=A0A5A7VCB8_CUCMM|nr:serpin-ZX-like [Cucumis melo var. makuwa]